jgi:hypothetical protein
MRQVFMEQKSVFGRERPKKASANWLCAFGFRAALLAVVAIGVAVMRAVFHVFDRV